MPRRAARLAIGSAELLRRVKKEGDMARDDGVVESVEGRVILMEGEALRPGAVGELRREDKIERLIEGGAVLRIERRRGKVHEEAGRARVDVVVEGAVPVIMVILFPAPAFRRRIAIIRGDARRVEIDEVMPAAEGMLTGDERARDALRPGQVVAVPGRAEGIEHERSHRGRPRRLDPDLGGPRRNLPPAFREVGGISPDESVPDRSLLHHESSGPFHGRQGLVPIRIPGSPPRDGDQGKSRNQG